MSLYSLNLSLGGVPALVVYRGVREEALRRGVMLFLHGLGASKEVNAPELDAFAEQGLFAVGLDAVGHGERRLPDFDARFNLASPDFQTHFLELIRASAREVPAVFDALVGMGAAPQRLGVCGVSMGGFIAYASVLADPRVRAVVPLLASPEWVPTPPDSPHLHAERFFPVALFSQTAGLDEVVSPEQARAFHARLEPLYARAPERLRYRDFPASGHMMRPQDWEQAIRDAAAWLAHFLSGPPGRF